MKICRIESCSDAVSGRSSLCAAHIAVGRSVLSLRGSSKKMAKVLAVPIGPLPRGITNLYAVKAGSFIKFGVSRNVMVRVSNLQVGNPLRLQVIGWLPVNSGVEGKVHFALKDEAAQGEWFRLRGKTTLLTEAIFARSHQKLADFLGISVAEMTENDNFVERHGD